ncbi:MAG: glycosyltransferase [Dehalococcoidia bacterium]
MYDKQGRRRVGPPLRFGTGIFWHMLRHGGRYDAVHTDVFPYFSVIGIWAALRLRSLFQGRRARARLVVDWFELWTRDYWTRYLGAVRGRIGHAVQRLCTRLPDQSIVFSELHERRMGEQGHSAPLQRLTGIFSGSSDGADPTRARDPVVVFAGRHIAEKQVTAIPAAIAVARKNIPKLRCAIYGDGPERERVLELVHQLGLGDAVELPGFVGAEQVAAAIDAAACLVLPSVREGYGLVVVEAVSRGTPAVVVAGPDNAAAELVEDGVNGFVAPGIDSASLAQALSKAVEGGEQLRRSTLDWYERHAQRLSLDGALNAVAAAYGARSADEFQALR